MTVDTGLLYETAYYRLAVFLVSRGRTIRKCNLLHTFSGLWSVKGEEPPLEESDLKILGSCKTRKTTYRDVPPEKGKKHRVVIGTYDPAKARNLLLRNLI